MSKIDNRYRDNLSWNDKANINPLYAVMSDEVFLTSGSQPSQEELQIFFNKGVTIWNQNLQSTFSSFKNEEPLRVLEYGCSMGRVLRIPFAAGATCFGVDISEQQLRLAQQYTFEDGSPHLMQFVPKQRINVETNSIDFAYSYAVLPRL